MKYPVTTQKALRLAFWAQAQAYGLSYTVNYRPSYRQNRYPVVIRCHWCDYVESMRRAGQISEKLAQRATL